MSSEDNDDSQDKSKTIVIASSPTGRILRDSPEWQHLTIGSTPDVVIIDEATPIRDFKWPETFPNITEADYAEIESRFFGLYPGVVELTKAMKRMGDAFDYAAPSVRLTGDELKSLLQNNPTLLMDKHEQQHANHPTEKNPNHPRFQRQPTRARRKK